MKVLQTNLAQGSAGARERTRFHASKMAKWPSLFPLATSSVGSQTPLSYHLSQNQLVMKNGTIMVLWVVGCVRKAFEQHSTTGAHEGCTRNLTVPSSLVPPER